MLEDSLAEVTYDAELAGLHYYFTSDGKGLGVTVYGYSDKLSLLLDVVLQRLKDIQFEEDRLKVKKEEASTLFRVSKTSVSPSFSWKEHTRIIILANPQTLLRTLPLPC